jgi:C-terminal peptidase prc
MVKRIAFLALFLIGGLLAQAVRADEQTGRPYVVVVGIDKYQDAQIKPRKHGEADAKALVELLLDKERLGVEKERVKLLLGSGPVEGIPSAKATKENILKALQELEKATQKDDLVIFAIFGNGAPVGERTCYFAVDSTFKDRAKDAVASSEIEHAIEKVPSQRFVSMVDVHFLGFDPGKERAPDLNTQNIFQVFLSQGDENKDPPPSRVLFIAGAASKPSLDLDKHGIFATALLDGLGGKADANGYESDGNIMVTELAKYVRKKVPELARANGKTKEEKEQKSGVLEAQAADFVVAYNPSARAVARDRLKKFEALVTEKQLDKKIADEGRGFLSRMPKLEAQQNLRKAYQQLVDGKIDVAAFNAERANIVESRKLSEKDAGKYAITIMRAADLVRKSYYKEVVKPPLVAHAIDGLYKSVEERVPSDLKDRLDRVKEMKDAELLRLLTDARQHLGTREDLGKSQDITYSLNAMLGKLDKHTGYIPPEVVERFRSDTSGSFKGIGVQIRRNEARDQLQVVTPIYNSPAYKAGLRANDIITTIISEVDPKTGKPYDEPIITPTKGMTTEDAVKKILGKPGTRIKIVVDREGSAKPIEFNLIRNTVEVESVLGHKRDDKDAWNYVIDPENKICYVRLLQFSENTYAELEKVMKQLSKEGIKGFILDLRFNPGGLLDVSIKISDLFINDGTIVTIRHRDGKVTSYVGRSDGSYLEFPMVCLINGGSASASEIVSACLQDHGRAIIMGSRSFGKGSVQTIHGFDGNSILKLTTATFWRPLSDPVTMKGNLNKLSTKGRDEDEWGVKPNKGYGLDLSKKETDDLFDHLREAEIIRGSPPRDNKIETKTEFRDRQLDMAVEYLRNQIRTASRKDAKRDDQNR